MKILYVLLTISLASGGLFDSFIKYSTIYTSAQISSPLANQTNVGFTGADIVQETVEIPYDYNYSFGIRKMARFKYQIKKGHFYDGSENELTDNATLGAVTGWEYLIQYSDVRSVGNEYKEQEYWLRYLGESYTIKAQYSEFGEQELTFGQLDMKYRKQLGGFDFTAGVSFRGRPIVIKPVIDWENQFEHWWELAWDMQWLDVWYWLDTEETEGDYYWYNPEGELVCDTDAEFYDVYFDGIVQGYYHSLIQDHGWNFESSLAIGIDYYHYGDKFWFHAWGTVYPQHYALSDYIKDLEREMDHDIGIIMGYKLSKHIGIFTEGRHLSYFNTKDITNEHFELKTGLNFTIF